MKLLWPIKDLVSYQIYQIYDRLPYISQVFGEHPEVYAQFGINGHNGIDIAAAIGTPIYAAHDGTIKFLKDIKDGKLVGYGNYAEITDSEKKTVYGHMSKFEGSNRDVKAGDIIGYVGSTGFSTGPHLHFGLKPIPQDINNGYKGSIDPMPYLKIMNDNIVIYKNGSEYQLAHKAKSEEGFAQQLFDANASNLLTPEGKPNFTEIDKIARIL